MKIKVKPTIPLGQAHMFSYEDCYDFDDLKSAMGIMENMVLVGISFIVEVYPLLAAYRKGE